MLKDDLISKFKMTPVLNVNKFSEVLLLVLNRYYRWYWTEILMLNPHSIGQFSCRRLHHCSAMIVKANCCRHCWVHNPARKLKADATAFGPLLTSACVECERWRSVLHANVVCRCWTPWMQLLNVLVNVKGQMMNANVACQRWVSVWNSNIEANLECQFWLSILNATSNVKI